MKFVENQVTFAAHLLLIKFTISRFFQNLRLKYYQEDDIIDEMTLAEGTKDINESLGWVDEFWGPVDCA